MNENDADLGDPMVPQPGDPTALTLHVDSRDVQAIVAGLNELPSKLSRRTLNALEAQVREAVLSVRRQGREAKRAADTDRQQKAEERRQRRNARHARLNGTPEPPAAQ